jgi:preprotein translocase subunit SecG
MIIVISILILLVSLLLVLVVLVQNPKGGGLAAGFSSGTQVMGARRTADFLEKATWGLAGLLFVLSILSTSLTVSNAGEGPGGTSTTKDKAAEMNTKQQPVAPSTKPSPVAPPPSGGSAVPPTGPGK